MSLRKFLNPSQRKINLWPEKQLFLSARRPRTKPVSRYLAQRNKKTQPDRLEMKKYNPNLRRHTVHREIK